MAGERRVPSRSVLARCALLALAGCVTTTPFVSEPERTEGTVIGDHTIAADSPGWSSGPGIRSGAGVAEPPRFHADGAEPLTGFTPTPFAGAAVSRSSPNVGYLKGSTHVHTARSGDSSTRLAEVVRWYEENDYDFIVVTDHNRVTPLPRDDSKLLVIPGVELTHNPGRCVPRPRDRCRIHVNSLFVSPAAAARRARREGLAPGERMHWRETRSRLRVDMYQRALDTSDELGGLAQVNHPTWYRGVDGALLAELGHRGFALVEIANQAFVPWNRGGSGAPSSEAIWDHALTAGAVVWGVASDDAHHYYDAEFRARAGRRTVYPAGTGFVMVRAERTPAAIRAALARGDFYSSTGVLLDHVTHDADRLAVSVASPGEHTITFIGPHGEIIATRPGPYASVAREGRRYIRAVVRDRNDREAWVQPVFGPGP